jgi:hypothetical protein
MVELNISFIKENYKMNAQAMDTDVGENIDKLKKQ